MPASPTRVNSSSPHKTTKDTSTKLQNEQTGSSSREETPSISPASPPRAKSPTDGNDGERKKFFVALLQSKTRQTIPEETEIEKLTSENTRSESPPYGENSSKVIDEKSIETPEKLPRSPNAEQTDRGATGVVSDLRGAEVAEKFKVVSSGESDIINEKEQNINDSDSLNELRSDKVDEDQSVVSTNVSNLDSASSGNVSCPSKLENVKPAEKPDKQESDMKDNVSVVQIMVSNAEGVSNNTKTVAIEEARTVSPELKSENDGSDPILKSGTELFAEMKAKDETTDLSLSVKSSIIGSNIASTELKESNEVTEIEQSTTVSLHSDETSSNNIPEMGTQSPKVQALGSLNKTPEDTEASREGSSTSSQGATAAADPAQNFKAHVHIPEFLWSPVHQRLLGDLMFAIEADIQVWRR